MCKNGTHGNQGSHDGYTVPQLLLHISVRGGCVPEAPKKGHVLLRVSSTESLHTYTAHRNCGAMCSKLTAHGEKLRGKRGGGCGEKRRRRRDGQQASVSMATTTSPTATNFLLC